MSKCRISSLRVNPSNEAFGWTEVGTKHNCKRQKSSLGCCGPAHKVTCVGKSFTYWANIPLVKVPRPDKV